MIIKIGGVPIHYTSINELQAVVEAKLAEIEKKIKKVGDEFKKLRRERRALKLAIGSKRAGTKPPAADKTAA